MLLSIVVPAYNESESLAAFYEQLFRVLTKMDKHYDSEIVFVDDGSRDKTVKIISELARKDKRIRLISLSRNYGKEIALTAGIHAAKGDVIISLDADGQHPPELIPEFIRLWKAGNDVVIGVRASNQKEGTVKKYGSKLFYQTFNKISGIKLLPRSTDFRLISQEVADEFSKINHHNRITRGLIDLVGYKRETISFDAAARIGGEANYSFGKLLNLAINSFVSLSTAPLRIFMRLGLFISGLALIGGIFVIIEQFILSDPLDLNVQSSGFLALLLLLLSGLILVGQGMTSMYIANIYQDIGNRPLYSIAKRRSIRP